MNTYEEVQSEHENWAHMKIAFAACLGSCAGRPVPSSGFN